MLARQRRHARGRQTNGVLHVPVRQPTPGLLLNALFGVWWADAVAALTMVPIIVKEGIEGLRVQLGSKTRSFCGYFGGLIGVRAIELMGLRV
jgi:hypothetical protein